VVVKTKVVGERRKGEGEGEKKSRRGEEVKRLSGATGGG
jgi:hypothetical protein